MTHPPENPIPKDNQSRPTILCIDDDPDVRRSLEVILANYDVEVCVEPCGRLGALDVFYKSPDLIITDLRMPHGSGEQLLELVKNNTQTAHIPVIVVTGQRHPHLQGRLKLLGATGFLQKPFHYESLLEEIRKHILLCEMDWATVKNPSA